VTETMAYVHHVAQELRASSGSFQYTILPRYDAMQIGIHV